MRKGEPTPLPNVPRVEMKSKEYKAFRQFYGMFRTLQAAEPILRERFKTVPTLWRDVKCMLYLAQRIYYMTFLTIPTEDYQQAEIECQHTKCVVQVEPVVLSEKQYTVVPVSALRDLILAVDQWECLTCEKTGKLAKSCPLRKTFNTLLPYEYEDGKSPDCPFSGRIEVL